MYKIADSRFVVDPKVYEATVKQSASPGEYNLDKSKYAYCLDIQQVTNSCTEMPMANLETCTVDGRLVQNKFK